MTRLVDFGYAQLNAMYDGLPVRGKLAIICGRFDAWVKGNGAIECISCAATVNDPGGICNACASREEDDTE